jgi:Polyketide cyclase / dehydrase and lipid transport
LSPGDQAVLLLRDPPDIPLEPTMSTITAHIAVKVDTVRIRPPRGGSGSSPATLQCCRSRARVTCTDVVDVVVEQRIGRSRQEVAGFAMDPRNDARWILALDDVRVLTDGPVDVGTRVQRIAKFLGRTIEYVNEIDEYDPPNRLSMHSVKAPFPMTVVYEFDESGANETLARIRAGGDAKGFYNLAAPLLERMVKRGIERDLKELKRLLEADAPPPAASPDAPAA